MLYLTCFFSFFQCSWLSAEAVAVGQKNAGDAEEILKAEERAERAERAEQRGQEEADREKQDGDAM
jgi:hypothetical protein